MHLVFLLPQQQQQQQQQPQPKNNFVDNIEEILSTSSLIVDVSQFRVDESIKW
jgi:transcription initiation factor TFIID subunit TAF12